MATGNSLNLPLTLSNGQTWIGNGTAIPAASILTAGSGVTVTNGSGSITLNSINKYNFISVSTSTKQMVNGEIYLPAVASGDITFTLPASSNIGDVVGIAQTDQSGTGKWNVVYGTGQYINNQASLSTVTTGSAHSFANFNSAVLLICSIANTEWSVMCEYSIALT